ncbi:ankyrin repeat and SOCS box protein 3 isoform X2 [Hippocampus comes]|uniref:Ankyrin repeat and SOCS box containing 3 n=1 Tax=Hippocampus comes TaxID=109280 RepID=A0A3Q2YBY5_HIPCM|nr:PREDICTED: ankyrin repeat and SOCS box protein 3-like isoform X2 [Hippocampus comes]
MASLRCSDLTQTSSTASRRPGMDFSACYEDSVSSVAAAARLGNKRRMRYLIRQGHTVDLADNRGWRAIHEAAAAGRVGCLKEILSAAARTAGSSAGFQAYVNSATHEGESACFLAARSGHLDAVRLLLKARANIDQLTNDLSCPLYVAVSNGHKDVVQLLLAKGAMLDRSHTASCWTCLHLAVYQDHVDIVRLLVESADLEAPDDYKVTPLFLAAQHGRRQCLEVLVHAGANVNAQAVDLASPLLLASQEGHLSCVDFLLQHGADANLVCGQNWPQLPIHAAAEFGHLSILRRLLRVTERACDRDEGMVSPLYLAVQGRQLPSMELLLAEGFSPDAQDCDSLLDLHSPLSLALECELREEARLLLAAGATLDLDEWSLVLSRHDADVLKLVLEHRWLYPPRFLSDDSAADGRSSKTALRPPEFDDMLLMALQQAEFADSWLPPLLKAGLEPKLLLHCNIMKVANSEMVNFLLQFVNWSTMPPSLKDILCQRRARKTWQPLPQFDSIPDLSHLCRLQIRILMGADAVMRPDVVGRLPVPPCLHHFLQFDDIA